MHMDKESGNKHAGLASTALSKDHLESAWERTLAEQQQLQQRHRYTHK